MKLQKGASSFEVMAILAGIFITVIVVVLLSRQTIQTAKQEHEAAQGGVAERVAPAGKVDVAPAAPAAEPAPAAEAAPAAEPTPAAAPATADAAPAAGDKGKSVYDGLCMACHAAGIAGAPKFGDKAAWEPRIAQGNDLLYQHAIGGFTGKAGMMPPKGGNAALADDDVKAAVDYMVGAAK